MSTLAAGPLHTSAWPDAGPATRTPLPADHGGPDAQGTVQWDFSTNANACGPAPMVLQAVQQADASRYPDPSGQSLRERLAAWHGVQPGRIVLAASASEFIVRMTSALRCLHGPALRVQVPTPGYGDYARVALAVGASLAAGPQRAHLVWHTDPGSPHGQSEPAPLVQTGTVRVVDCAYAPLRLQGNPPAPPASAWQLWSPNKALGLTGVRAAYAVAPAQGEAQALVQLLQALAPSWPLGAHGVALLESWTEPGTQQWLQHSLQVLAAWKERQLAVCAALGWSCEPSDAPFFVARWPQRHGPVDTVLARLRTHGVKLRDTASMGLPGAVRLGVRPPDAQDALQQAWNDGGSLR